MAVQPSALNPQTIAADCDLLKQIALKHPDQLRELITAMKTGGIKGIQKAEKITRKIGLTEENAIITISFKM